MCRAIHADDLGDFSDSESQHWKISNQPYHPEREPRYGTEAVFGGPSELEEFADNEAYRPAPYDSSVHFDGGQLYHDA